MQEIKEITPAVIRDVRALALSKVEEAFNEVGLSVKFGRAKYTPTSIDLNMEVLLEGIDPYEESFNAYCHMFDLEPGDKGKKFSVRGEEFTLIDLKPSRPKYPVLAENWQGKLYKFNRGVLENLR